MVLSATITLAGATEKTASCGQHFSSTCADGMPGNSATLGVFTCCGIDCEGPWYNPCSQCLKCRSHEEFEGREIGPELAGVPLVEFPFVMAHDAATGYNKHETCNVVHQVNNYAVTQPKGGFITQLECGARSLDLRPLVTGDKEDDIIFHHSTIQFDKSFSQGIDDVISWSAKKPGTLVLLVISNCDGDDCWKRVFDLLEKKHIRLLVGTEVSSWTVGQALQEGRLPGSAGGSIVAATSKRMESNYHSNIPYEFPGPGDFNLLYEGMDKECNFAGSANEEYGGKLWQFQAHWQYNTERVAKGVATGSCILKEEEKHNVNANVAKKIASGAVKHLNLVGVDNVCNGGPELFKAMREWKISDVRAAQLQSKYDSSIVLHFGNMGPFRVGAVVAAAALALVSVVLTRRRAKERVNADAEIAGLLESGPWQVSHEVVE
eukprot:TRINITY_DN45418_c0_g1_i1.p1 TRINITY_DN45418_c0_g1~~TRINITY_DN45418_c0_g1_i1.p1  ORF type:complete len:470 (+),score=62.51 TRINITY_DN45418_c0_g1_i1:109-1410(+)